MNPRSIPPAPENKDITLYGSWKKEDVYYTVTFDTDGGSLIESIQVLEGTHITDIPNPTKENLKNPTVAAIASTL